MRRIRVVLTVGLISALAAACGSSDESGLVGHEVAPAPQVGSFSVDDASTNRSDLPLKADPGELLIAFLGFTNCPDVCPTALADIRTARSKLGAEEAASVDMAMLTIDPERDTAEVLTRYIRQFAPDGRALRTDDPAELKQITAALGAGFEVKHDHGQSQVGHTDYTYLLDDTGAVILTWTAEMTPDDITADLRSLLRASSKSN